MLLAIADFSDDHGKAYPSVGTLSNKCRMSRRNVQYVINNLKDSGELTVAIKKGPPPKFPNLYRINLNALQAQPIAQVQSSARTSAIQRMSDAQPIAHKPSVTVINHKGRFSKSASPKGEYQTTGKQTEPKKAQSRGERLSPDWQLPDDWRSWCVQCRPDLDPDDVALVFKNHWIAKPGLGACKLNWYATWQNWVKSQRAMPARPMGTNAPSGALTSKPYGFGGI